MAPHEEFLELCAISLSGELSADERGKLDEHLRGCSSCRKALEQFKASVKATIPAVAEQNIEGEYWDTPLPVEKAEAAFFSRFDREDGFQGHGLRERPVGNDSPVVANGVGWGPLWMPFVAILLLSVALGIASYHIGMKKGVETVSPTLPVSSPTGLGNRLSDAGRERQKLLTALAARDQTIAELRKQIWEQTNAIQRQKAPLSAGQNDSSVAGLAANATTIESLQKQLDAEELARSQQAARITELEAKMTDLSRQLQENGVTIAQQKRRLDEEESALNHETDLLEHDQDIRDLMGARQLHVVDVYDVGGTGTNKPYGRVFYTQGKSLIFYAYDLDQALGVERASTFQAWGRRGPNKDQAINLGIFYEDVTANKRWVVKFDDPNSLTQIDGVFVTIEPDTHSRTPRGKQVLFAYLDVNPNHP